MTERSAEHDQTAGVVPTTSLAAQLGMTEEELAREMAMAQWMSATSVETSKTDADSGAVKDSISTI